MLFSVFIIELERNEKNERRCSMQIVMTFLLFSLSFIGSLGQAQEAVQDQEYNLQPIRFDREGEVTPARKDGITCGKYFYLNSKDPDKTLQGTSPFIYLEYNTFGQLNVTEIPVTISGSFISKDKFITIVDFKKIVPTVSWISNQGGDDTMPFHVVIRISREDLREARPCIPDPK